MSGVSEQAASSVAVVSAPGTNRRANFLLRTLAVGTVLGFLVPFGVLLIGLHFPDQSAATSFSLYQHSGATILVAYYVLAWDGILLTLFCLLVPRRTRATDSSALVIARVAGALGGLMQTIGYLRWPFLLPTLAGVYNDPHASESTRAAAALTFAAVDQILGVMMSEHLFYIFIGGWSIALGWFLLRTAQRDRWVAWLGVVSGACFLLSSVEQFDLAALSSILLIVVIASRLLWGAWVVSLAWRLDHLLPPRQLDGQPV